MIGLCAAVAACSREDLSDDIAGQLADSAEQADAAVATTNRVEPVQPPVDFAAATQVADSLDKMLRQVKPLSRWEQMKLRRDVNARQIERAQQLGIKPSSDLERLVAEKKLEPLPDDATFWTLYNLKYSAPYVTPSTAVLLEEIGERFQAKLDSLGVPRVRLVITSALRTPDDQNALRKRNSNASRTESAHEYGTTVDIAYRRFAPPAYDAEDSATSYDPVRALSDSLIVTTANKRSAELQAILGRILQDMQKEGKVMVMMERRQTVYHMTVARPLTRRDAPAQNAARNAAD